MKGSQCQLLNVIMLQCAVNMLLYLHLVSTPVRAYVVSQDVVKFTKGSP